MPGFFQGKDLAMQNFVFLHTFSEGIFTILHFPGHHYVFLGLRIDMAMSYGITVSHFSNLLHTLSIDFKFI